MLFLIYCAIGYAEYKKKDDSRLLISGAIAGAMMQMIGILDAALLEMIL